MSLFNRSSSTLDDMMRDAIKVSLSAEDLHKKCQKAAEAAVAQAIDAAFSRSSPFVEMVTNAVKDALPVVRPDDMGEFAHSVRLVVQNRLLNLASQTARQQMDMVLNKLVPDSKVITIDELREAFIEKVRNEHSIADCECHDSEYEPEITWRTETSKNVDGWFDLIISDEADASRYSGKDTISLRMKPSSEDKDLQECWYFSVGRSDNLSTAKLFMGPLYGFDAMAFRLAVGTARLAVTRKQLEALA